MYMACTLPKVAWTLTAEPGLRPKTPASQRGADVIGHALVTDDWGRSPHVSPHVSPHLARCPVEN